MVEFAKRKGIEYAIKEENEITIDNPVGSYLFERFREKPRGKVSLEGERKSYEQLLDDFEQGRMTKKAYDFLLKKAKPGNLSDIYRGLRASTILKSELAKNILGNIDKLAKETGREELERAAYDMSSFVKFVKNYFSARENELPEFGDYKRKIQEIIKKASGRRDLEELAGVLTTLRVVLQDKTAIDFEWELKHPENQAIYKEFCNAAIKGDLFAIGKIYKQLGERYPESVDRFNLSKIRRW